MQLHSDLTQSGLSSIFEMGGAHGDLSHFIGKTVRYKPELLTPEFVRVNGTITQTAHFKICMTQRNYMGELILRGFDTSRNDTFGRPLTPSEVEIID